MKKVISVLLAAIGIPILIYQMLTLANKCIFYIYLYINHIDFDTLTQNQIDNILMSNVYIGSVVGEFLAVLILLIIFFFTKEGLIKRCKFRKVKPKKLGVITLIMIGFSFLSITFIYFMQNITTSYSSTEQAMHLAWQSGIEIIGTVILVPILEEILFRGAIFSVLKNNLNIYIAIIIQGIVFAVMHGNLVQSGYTFFLGIILVLISDYAGSMIGDIYAHMVFNLFGLIIMPVLQVFFFNPYIYIIIGIVVLGLGAYLYYLDIKKQRLNINNIENK